MSRVYVVCQEWLKFEVCQVLPNCRLEMSRVYEMFEVCQE